MGEYSSYCIYRLVSLSWDEAHAHCQQDNAHLWSINSHEEWEILFNYFKDYAQHDLYFMDADGVYIGWRPLKVR